MASVGVLVLEDHPIVSASLVLSLSAAGMTVSVAASTKEFFAKLSSTPVIVAIVDLGIDAPASSQPSQNDEGLGVLARLAEDYPHVRAIVFSADSRPEMMARCEQLGSWSYLTKLRAQPDEVVTAVLRVAAGERYVGEVMFGPPRRGRVDSSLLDRVSPRERQVLAHLSAGADNAKIAAHLEITERTVRAHVCSLYLKLGSDNRTHLALLARKLGVMPPPGY